MRHWLPALLVVALACYAEDVTLPDGRAPVVTRIALRLAVGDTTVLEARVVDRLGQVIANPVVSWQSANSAVATVADSGSYVLVAGNAAGSTWIVATSDAASDTVTVEVILPPASLGRAACPGYDCWSKSGSSTITPPSTR